MFYIQMIVRFMYVVLLQLQYEMYRPMCRRRIVNNAIFWYFPQIPHFDIDSISRIPAFSPERPACLALF